MYISQDFLIAPRRTITATNAPISIYLVIASKMKMRAPFAVILLLAREDQLASMEHHVFFVIFQKKILNSATLTY